VSDFLPKSANSKQQKMFITKIKRMLRREFFMRQVSLYSIIPG